MVPAEPHDVPASGTRGRYRWHPRGDHIVAIILAVGIVVAINVFTFAAVYSAISSNDQLSENATQILTGWGGGVIGVIGAIVGYTAGHNAAVGSGSRAMEERTDL